MPATDGYITIDEAVAKYGPSRDWWFKQIAEGKITSYEIPGFRPTFLKIDEVEAYLKPRPKNIDKGQEHAG